MATNTEEIILRMGMDSSGVQRGMQMVSGKIQSWGKSISNMIDGAMLLGGINKIISHFDDLQDRADNLDLSTGFLQGMSQISAQNAVGGQKTFDKAITELSAKLGAAKNNSAEAVKAFQKYGITVAEIQGMNSEQMFFRIADAVKSIPDPAQRTAAAFELLGKAGKNMTGILAGGSAELGKMVDAVDKLDAEKVKEIAAIKDNIESVQNTAFVWGGKLLGWVGDYYKFVGRLSTGLDTFEKDAHERKLQRIDKEKKAQEDAINGRMAAEKIAAEAEIENARAVAAASWKIGDRIKDLINKRAGINRTGVTIQEIADSPTSPYRLLAQTYLRAEKYQKEMRLAGNIPEAERARGWMNFEQQRLSFYMGSGLVKDPLAEMQNIDAQIAELNAKLKDGTINVKVVGTE